MPTSQARLIRLWVPVWLVFAAFFENMAQQPLISVFSVSLGASATVAGLTVSIYSLFNLGGNLISHWALGRVGPRWILGWVMLTAGLLVTASGFCQTPQQLLLLRSLHGLAGGLLVPVIFVQISTASTRQRHGITMARGGIAIALASTIGPVLAGFVNQRAGFATAFTTIGSVLITSGLIALLLIPHHTPPKRRTLPLKILKATWGGCQVRSACRIAFAFMAALGIMAFRFPLKGQEVGLTSGQIGLGFGMFSLAAAIVMAPAGCLSDRHGRRWPLLGGLVVSTLGMLGLSWGQTFTPLLMAMVGHGAGFGMLFPVSNALLLDGCRPQERSAAFGVFHAFFSLGVFTGPLVAIALMRYTSPFHVAAAILLITATLTASSIPSRPRGSPGQSTVAFEQRKGR